MLYLLLAVVSSSVINLVMRLSEGRIHNKISMLAVNYATCLILAAGFSGFDKLFPVTDGIGIAVGLGAIGGVLYLSSFLLLQWNISQNGIVLPATFMKLGVLVPAVMSMVLFGERPGPAKLWGLAASVAAILLINLEKGQSQAEHKGGLLLLLLAGGGADAMSKIYEQVGAAELKNQFLLYIFLFALLLCLLLAFQKKQRLCREDVLYGFLVGLPNYFSARFLLLALGRVPAVAAYPTFSVGTILVVAAAGTVLFREKLSRRQLAAVAVILAALVLLNL